MPDEQKNETPAKDTKLPLSGPAISSLVLTALSLVALIYCLIWSSNALTSPALPCAAFGFIVAFFLGAGSIICVCWRTASIRSLFFAIPSVLLPAILIACTALWLKNVNTTMACGMRLSDLGSDLVQYSGKNNERYPDPNKWCDLLIEKAEANKHNFRCRGDKIGPCSYALNPNATTFSRKDVVLLFESKPGWNQHGGPELLDPSHHWPRGCQVLFDDGHTQFVAEKDLPNLRWTKEQKPPK